MSAGRFALLIATGSYDNADLRHLRSPARDAAGLAEVLQDRSIGDFEVSSVLDARHHEVNRAIETFFRNRSRDDVLLLHLTCHGIKNDNGELYFAARDTDRELLGSTAVSAAFLQTQMRRCRARSIVLLLDCCYSGAFLPGSKGDTAVHLKDELAGYGRAVLTATNRTEYAWEGDHLSELDPAPSRFTGLVIEGLRSGEADANRDGLITVGDLYEYVYERILAIGAKQRPLLWAEFEYRVVIAHTPFGNDRRQAPTVDLLGGRYELDREFGQDGISEIRLAHDTRLDSTVVVMTLRAEFAHDQRLQAEFRRDVRSTASLNHPAIVAVHDRGEGYVDGVLVPYIVMEHVDGSTVDELLDSGRGLPPTDALKVTSDILQGLEHAHRNGIVHRDISPANVMLTRDGHAKVTGFGSPHPSDDDRAVVPRPDYCSPEQALGRPTDARSDLYMTGCLLYALLTGRPPFSGESETSTVVRHVLDDPPPPSSLEPAVAPETDAVVLTALAKRPDERYQSADAMRSDIEACLDGSPTSITSGARPAPASQPTGDRAPDREPSSKSRRTALVAGDLLLTFAPGESTRARARSAGPPAQSIRKRTAQQRAEWEQVFRPPVLPEPPLPRMPPLWRQDEREELVRMLSRGRSVRLLGPRGSGRTALLDCIEEDVADLPPDGVIRLSGNRRTSQDLFHDVFTAAYWSPLQRPCQSELLALAGDIGAIVIIDDLEIGGSDLGSLLDCLPECAVLVCPTPATASTSADDSLEDVVLGGLDEASCMELLNRRLLRWIADEERVWARDLWRECAGLPLSFVQAAAVLGPGDVSLPWPADPAAVLHHLFAATSEPGRAALEYGLALGGELPNPVHLPALVGHPHADTAVAELLVKGLVTASDSHYRLAAGVAEQLPLTGHAPAVAVRRARAAEHYAWWAGHPSVVSDRVVAESAAVLAALGAPTAGTDGMPKTTSTSYASEEHIRNVVKLARAASPAFAAGLRWSAWEQALGQGLKAARTLQEGAEVDYFERELSVVALARRAWLR
ncbi:caspase, EACC1-associated type [Streptomyces sp. HD]|uniref:caspase, EACC1-associated type n=1 Tax=Streptomyces sp. HD TaxID=3020892 RepID=UPI002FEDEB54